MVETRREMLFRFLSRLENHFVLCDESLRLIAIRQPAVPQVDPSALVEIRGPLGLSRLVATRLTQVRPPDRLAGTARVGRRTRAQVAWLLEPAGNGTRVSLLVEVQAIAPLDRLLLALGGRSWLRRRFKRALRRLEQNADRAPLRPCYALRSATAVAARWAHS
jgi:hypothetical protein